MEIGAIIGMIAVAVLLIIIRSRRLVRENVNAAKQAAGQGEASAEFTLGLMYADGHGVPRDDAKAVELWHKAAGQGYAPAQFTLGFVYANGKKGVPKDEAKAAEWYQKAAEQGDARAQEALEKLDKGIC